MTSPSAQIPSGEAVSRHVPYTQFPHHSTCSASQVPNPYRRRMDTKLSNELPAPIRHSAVNPARTAPGLKLVLVTAIVVSAVALAVAIVIAVFVDVQSDFLAERSEQSGGFDPSVLPPWNGALWLISNIFPVLVAILLILLIVARSIAGSRRDCDITIDNIPS